MGGAFAIVVASDLQPKVVANMLHMFACTALSPLLLPLLLPRICDPNPFRKSVTIPHVYGAVAIVVARMFDPKSVTKTLHIHAFTALSPMLLPRICDPTPDA